MNANANASTPTIADLAATVLTLQATHKNAKTGEATARQNLHEAVVGLLTAVADLDPVDPAAPATTPPVAAPEVFPQRPHPVRPHE